MRALDAIEQRIWNAGERLIPGVTHDVAEVVRHKSSYLFFKNVIESDLISNCLGKSRFHILDIGCGVGHGAYMLADIPGAAVTGIDSSEEAIVYGKLHYGRENITYRVADAVSFIKGMPEFDYVVSRHSLEHIVNGIQIGAECRFGARLMVNVPFAEPEGNAYHYVHFIREDSFASYPNREIFYESLDGWTFCDYPEKTPNSIVCISSRVGLPNVATQFSFPLRAWNPEFLQAKWLEAVDRQKDFETVAQQQSNQALELAKRETNVVDRESEVARREAELSERESVLASREAQFAAREADFSENTNQLDSRKHELARLESSLLHRETQLNDRETRLNDRETRLNDRQAQLDELTQQFDSRVIVKAFRKIKRLL